MVNVTNWFTANKLHLNSKKPTAVLFRPYQKNTCENPNGIMLLNNFIPFAESALFLGIVIDCNLSWSHHIDSTCRKLARGTGIILKLSHFLPKNILLTIYNSLVLPFISYCSIVWGNASAVHINKIFIIQKRIFRAIDHKSKLDHSRPIFYRYSSLTIFDIVKFQISVFMYQFSKNLLPNSFVNYFSTYSHSYSTRHNSNYVLPFYKLSLSQRNIRFLGPVTWNGIPVHIKNSSTVSSFKRHVKTYLLSGYD